MSAHAGGMCMSQCKHWRIPFFLFCVSRKRKRNARESCHSDQKDSDFDTIRVPFLLPIVCVACYNDLDKSEFIEINHG